MLHDISFLFDNPDIQTKRRLERVQLAVTSMEVGANNEKDFIAFEAHPQVYDSGKKLTVVYRRNMTWPDAAENHLLDLDFRRYNKNAAVLKVLNETVLPIISESQFYDTITRITLETVEGKLTVNISEDVEEIISYLPVPNHLSHITTVPITELVKVQNLAMGVDHVSWNGQSFAFKKTDEKGYLKETIEEITILDKLHDSPYIIDLIAIVVDNDGCVRGFLMPCMFAGNLTNVFRKGRKSQGLPDQDDKSKPVFDWSLRLSWARQVTQGVVDLHAVAAYNGDLKPTNVLINPSGEAVLIDFLTMGLTGEFAAPELYDKFIRHWTERSTLQSILTASGDVYSLGLVLYAIALEKTGKISHPLDYGMIPTWYQDIVKRCIVQDPADRPSAIEVLSLLDLGKDV